jgi:hypothetical protein
MHFTAMMIQVNDSVADKNLGAINGLGQSIGALARAVGPALGGILWSVSMDFGLIFLNFIGASALLIVCQVLNSQLPDPKPRLRSASELSNNSNSGIGHEQHVVTAVIQNLDGSELGDDEAVVIFDEKRAAEV